jgi:hypothetical protein
LAEVADLQGGVADRILLDAQEVFRPPPHRLKASRTRP